MKRLLLLGLALSVLGMGCGKDLPTSGSSGGEYPRVVLTELFTSLNCANCPQAEEALDELYEEEGLAKLAVIHWHPTRTLPDALGIPESDDRYEAYADRLAGIVGMPTAVFDGVAPILGGTTETYNHYRSRFDNESALFAPISVTLSPVILGNQIQVGLEVHAADELLQETFDLNVVLVEHKVPRPAGQPGPDTLSFVARVVDTQQLVITTPTGQTCGATLSVDPSWNQDQLYVVAILQEPDYGEVIQSAMAEVEEQGAGTFDFSFTVPDTSHVIEVSDDPYFAHMRFENTGTLDDTLRIDLPADYRDVPEEWNAFLCIEDSLCFPTPFDQYLAVGEIEEHLVIDLLALQEGTGWIGVTVQSLGDPTKTDSLRIHFTTDSPGGYSFTASAPQTEWQDAPVGEATLASMIFENTGELDDLLSVDIDTTQTSAPNDWALSICNDRGFCIGNHLDLAVEAGDTDDHWLVDCLPGSAGSAHIVVTVKSTGDPHQTATLTFDIETVGASVGFDRTVLGEMFTTWWCGNCPLAEEALDALYEAETSASLAVVHWHPHSGDSGGGLGIIETDARLEAYATRFGGTVAYPTVYFAGNERVIGINDSDTEPDTTYATYAASLEEQRSRKVPVDLALQASSTEETIDVTINIAAISGMESTDLDLHVVVVEHEAPLPLNPSQIYSYVARRANTQSLTLQGDDNTQLTSQFTIEEGWVLGNFYVVAFLQEPNYGEVLQAAMIPLPQGLYANGGAVTLGHGVRQ